MISCRKGRKDGAKLITNGRKRESFNSKVKDRHWRGSNQQKASFILPLHNLGSKPVFANENLYSHSFELLFLLPGALQSLRELRAQNLFFVSWVFVDIICNYSPNAFPDKQSDYK